MSDQRNDPQTALLSWYALNRRDLPWRADPTPYRVLVSELMLQQTQVDRVVPYFQAFLKSFPTIAKLASAPRSAVINAWAGLGYNRRAVYLHEIARLVLERHGGEIPADSRSLRALPGIGEYTANAILSIGFGHDLPALDTNAKRVISRYAFGGPTDPRALREQAARLVPAGHAREWNQALMDLASTVCTNRSPQCSRCPLAEGCLSQGAVPESTPRRAAIPFHESTRYFRGRLLNEVRQLAPDQKAPLSAIASSLAQKGVAEPAMGWAQVGEGLARDGLVAIQTPDRPNGELSIGLPS